LAQVLAQAIGPKGVHFDAGGVLPKELNFQPETADSLFA
jgi:hypothetical protein